MSSGAPPNVKIYDRPERKGPPPLILALALLVLLAVAFFAYRALHHAPPPPVPVRAGLRLSPDATLKKDAGLRTNRIRRAGGMGIIPQTVRPQGRAGTAPTVRA